MVRLSVRDRGSAHAQAEAVVWHDLECAYEADLALWTELCDRYGTRVLELGCGTGRLALHLGSQGCEVTALDHDPVLLRALRERASKRGLSIEAVEADASDFRSAELFDVVLASMQLMQLVAGPHERARVLERARAVLRRGGVLAAALAAPPSQTAGDRPPLPDMCEHDGWVYSSLPIAVRTEGSSFAIERLRQLVSPAGITTQSQVTIFLELLSADELEREAARLGFRARARREIPATEAHVASTVCVLEAI